MEYLYHGTGEEIERLVPGHTNAYGWGIYFSDSIRTARGYGDNVIAIPKSEVLSKVPLRNKSQDIYVIPRGLELKILRVVEENGARIKYAKIVNTLSENDAAEIGEKADLYGKDPDEYLNDKYNPFVEFSFFNITKEEIRKHIKWTNPDENWIKRIVNRVFGLFLGLLLNIVAFFAHSYKLKWLAHYLIGSGKPMELPDDIVDEILESSRKSKLKKRTVDGRTVHTDKELLRPNPDTEAFNVVGTCIKDGDRITDIYEFDRQYGQVFLPNELEVPNRAKCWATHKFKVGRIVAFIVRVTKYIVPAMKKWTAINGSTVLISNALWKAFGGKSFLSYKDLG